MSAQLRLVGADHGFDAHANTPLLGSVVRYRADDPDPLTELEPEQLPAHRERFGTLPDPDADELIDLLAAAGLTGRGGGHFPVAAKWRAARDAGGARLVIGNGCESEPLSRKDAALLELRPHLVLDGLMLTARTLGAADAVVRLHDDAVAARSSLMRALGERNGSDPVLARIETGPRRYVGGESSAVLQAVTGGRALPMHRRRPAARGADGRPPAVVHNVESLARIALVARGRRVASTLLTLAWGADRVVVEVGPDATLAGILSTAVSTAPPAGVLVGGYGGRWEPWAEVAHVPVGDGRHLGAGVIRPLQPGECGLAVTADVMQVLADDSAGQCGPCLFGLPEIAGLVGELARCRSNRRRIVRLEGCCAEVTGRGACHHPDGAAQLVRTALQTFADDVRAHLRGRCCA